jgi:hypothetical protein
VLLKNDGILPLSRDGSSTCYIIMTGALHLLTRL